ncbi:MAG: glutaminyl-peptide cyclotransferase [Bacteroidetes bacterium]|nr:glutaminyl-peptide cyclotransferase [Bacteroidota bacterium]
MLDQFRYPINVLIISSLLFWSCEEKKPSVVDATPPAPKNIGFSIVRSFPHDTAAYTQGLVIYKGNLYEGTGNYGKSQLKQVELMSGKTIQGISLANQFFGEGITILRDTVYQLTWQEKKVFVYTLPNFKKVKEFDVSFEGWGITHDGNNLIVTTGSGDLFFYRPQDFTLLRTQTVTESGSPSFNLNELEFIDGFIYANQYTYPYLLKIDPNTGEVVGKADLTEIWNRNKALNPRADVPNGIAYDEQTKKILVTGKWWAELYEIEFSH